MDARTPTYAASAQAAMQGRNETLWLAIHDRLQRAPESTEECERVIAAMSRDERVVFGAEDYSDDAKRECARCHTEHYGTGFCDNCVREMQEAARGVRI